MFAPKMRAPNTRQLSTLFAVATLSSVLALQAYAADTSPAANAIAAATEAASQAANAPLAAGLGGSAPVSSPSSAASDAAATAPAVSRASQSAGATADTNAIKPAASTATSEPSAQPVLAPVAQPQPASPVVIPASAAPVTAAPVTAPTASTAERKPVEAKVAPVDQLAPIRTAVREQLAKYAAAFKDEDAADRAALADYYKSDTATPLFVDANGLTKKARGAMALIAKADDWGLKSRDFVLPPDAPASTPSGVAAQEIKLAVTALKYVRFARGGRFKPTDLSYAIDRAPETLDPNVAVRDLARFDDAAIFLRQQNPRHPQFERLRLAYIAIRDGKDVATTSEPDDAATAKKGKNSKQAKKPQARELSRDQKLATLTRNMEMWRWMPRSLGRVHVIANIPEFKVRVIRNDTQIFEERIVVGKVEHQTPLFSEKMATVVFHPQWFVPDSIKVKEVLPNLLRRGSNGMVLPGGLRLQRGNKDVDPSNIDWRRTDIRAFNVYQPSGGGNVLGNVKFLFPNSHAVYMHDTPSKHLFSQTSRAYSHGCMRVRNPLQLAAVVLGEDKGWSNADVQRTLKDGPENNNVKLDTKIPVHVTYFTATVDDDGKLSIFKDVYGHEKLIQMGLDGKSHLIVKKKEDLGPIQADVVARLSDVKDEGGSSLFNWWGGPVDSGSDNSERSSNGRRGGSSSSSSSNWSSGGGSRAWVRDAFRND